MISFDPNVKNLVINGSNKVEMEKVEGNVDPDYLAHIDKMRIPNIAEEISKWDLPTLINKTTTYGFLAFDYFDPKGYHVIHYAARNRNPRIFLFFVTHGVCSDIEKAHMAIANGDSSMIKMDICVKSKRPDGYAPIHEAVAFENLAVVEALLLLGTPIDLTDAHLKTPLIIAAFYRKATVALYLLSNGANIHAEDEELDNCLHWAAYKGDTQLFCLFYNIGIDVNKTDSYMQSAAHMICNTQHLSTLKELLKKNPDLSLRDKKARTPLDIAKEKGFSSGVKLLTIHNRRQSTIERIKNSANYFSILRAYILLFSLYFVFHFLQTILRKNLWEYIFHSYLFTNIFFMTLMGTCYFGYLCITLSNYNDSDREAYRKLLIKPFTADSLQKFIENNHICHICQNVSDLKTIHCTFTDKCENNFFDYDFFTVKCITTRNINIFLRFYGFFLVFTILASIYFFKIGSSFIFICSFSWITALTIMRFGLLLYGAITKKSTAEIIRILSQKRHHCSGSCKH